MVLEVLRFAENWMQTGQSFALATVVNAKSSAPLPVGSSMVIGPQGEIFGSVSGGCVESAVFELGTEAIRDGNAVLQRFGISDEAAFTVGLTCGGIIDVLVQPVVAGSKLALLIQQFAVLTAAGVPVTWAATTGGPGMLGRTALVCEDSAYGEDWVPSVSPQLLHDLRSRLVPGHPTTLAYDGDGCAANSLDDDSVTRVFALPFTRAPRLIIVGAVEYAVPLSRLGKFLGFAVTVCDARPAFTSSARFPDADEIVIGWPDRHLAGTAIDERTAIIVLTHDEKFDVLAIKAALDSAAGYIGAMGSRRTHELRLERLSAAGVDSDEFGRIHSPIGLALGGRSAEETALAIMAEIVLVRNGGSSDRLSVLSGPIHENTP